ncbi:MAG: Ig-like domain-containing protein, partial [Gammaproteobacteria bacterium]
ADFGHAIAFSGTTALIGAEGAGAAYVFTGSGSNWTQSAKLTASPGAASADFGHAIAFSGTTALIGADGAGAAYVFTGSGSNWTQSARLVPDSAGGTEGFGSAVALSVTSALIGADGSGAAYVFTGSGSGWNQSAELTPSDASANGGFGAAVALDGTTALVGADNAEIAGQASQGAAYLFTESNGIWSQTRKFTASNGTALDHYGFAVALEGVTAMVGAPQANPKHQAHEGELYVYSQGSLGLAVSAPATAAGNATYVSQTIVTNDAATATPPLSVAIPVPASTQFVSVTSTPAQSCNLKSRNVICDLGSVGGNAGTATANVTLKANDARGSVIENTASVIGAQPPLTASAATAIVNSPPVAKDGTLTTTENKAANGMLVASDADGDPLTFAIVANPAHGTVKLDDASTGAYTYTPASGYSGSDSFTFKANDGTADSNAATISITVQASGNGGGSGGSGGGGGGSLGWPALAVLLSLALGAFGWRRLSYRRVRGGR